MQKRSNELHQSLKRILPRDNLCTTDDGKAIKDIQGTAVVWRYERIRKNIAAGSIPLVDVLFKTVDPHVELPEIKVVPIGISRLGSFRLGTIWQNGKCIAETDLGEDKEFTVDFTEGRWSYVSFTGKAGPSSLQVEAALGSVRAPDVLSELLSFPMPGGKTLLIPCIEFLVRGYGSTPDIARILATYPWTKVKTELYADIDLNPETWLVQPVSHIHDDDALLLASILYDPYAELAAKEIYSQLDQAHSDKMNGASLRVRPWFQGPANIRVRGRWVKNSNTFICYEITGMSEPQNHHYDIRRPRYAKKDPQGEIVTNINRRHVELPKAHDSFEITDLQEPDHGTTDWRKPDPGFKTLGPKCRFTRSTEERIYSERKIVTPIPSTPHMGSTGAKVGNNEGIVKVIHVARRFEGDGGILNAMWLELTRLKRTQPGFSSLAWYSDQGFYEDTSFRLQPLAPFHEDDSPKDEARRWLAFKDNATRVRGILVLRVIINGRSFYMFEPQRKQIRHGAAYEEETSYGLLMEIRDPALALEEISNICDKIRFCSGKFLALEGLKFSAWAFRHITRKGVFYANATLRRAFARMNVELMRSDPDQTSASPE